MLALSLLLTSSTLVRGYSVFTHEHLIDLTWNSAIQPLLLKRFPHSTATDLKSAHAYAYGGSAIQDLGYYPFSNEFFSDLAHYVRSGDFIVALLRDAQTVQEYAFALGALSHYVGDNIGHQDAVNVAVAQEFPKLEKKYGPSVTYDENPHAHVRTEFAFDVDQLAKHHLAPSAYLRFIGLQVPQRLLAQAFTETYALPLHRITGRAEPSVRSYRWSVRSFLPRIAYAETVLHRNALPPELDTAALQHYQADLSRADFETTWNRFRKSAGFKTHLIALLIEITPKIGVASDLAIKVPNAHTQDLYLASVNRAVAAYEAWLRQLGDSAQITAIPNRDLDTGEKTKPGAYPLTDETYAKLLRELTANPHKVVSSGLKEDVLAYYSDPDAPITTKKNAKAWQRVQSNLMALRQMGTPAAN